MIQAIEKSRHDLADPSLSDAEKAVALCWYLHLVADAHQPLHATALVSAEFPEGDRGGNLVFVRDGGEATNLHAYWDGRLGRSRDLAVLEWTAARATAESPRDTMGAAAEPAAADVYARESRTLAGYWTYLGGQLPMESDAASARELPADYGRASALVARRRVAQAGYRMAADLDELLTHEVAATRPATRPAGGAIVLDGRFDDWAELGDAVVSEADPAGDATGDNGIDVTRLAAVAEGTSLRIELGQANATNLSNGPPEAGTLRVRIRPADPSADWPGVELDLRNRAAHLLAADGEATGLVVPWQSIGFEALPTYASTRAEMRVDLGPLGAAAGDDVRITLDGTDALDRPLTVRLDHEATAPPTVTAADVARADGTSFRVADWNLLWGLAKDPERAAAARRLLAAAGADVVTFQEARKAEEATFLLGDGWNVVAAGDSCTVASKWPLRAVAVPDPLRAAAAVVDLPGDGPDALVVSVHLKCCGYLDSREDQKRVAQAAALAKLIGRLRAGDLRTTDGGTVAADTRLLIAGDWNLVGGETPLAGIVGLGLSADLPLKLGTRSATTWRALDASESFWPSRLDIMVHGDGLVPLRSFLLDTQSLGRDTLRAMDLRPGDGRASDHLMTVADFAAARGNE